MTNSFQGHHHKRKRDKVTQNLNGTDPQSSYTVPVYINLKDVQRKTKLVKILPALSPLKGNVEYKIINRQDKLFFIRERNGISSVHAKRKKLRDGMSYHVDVEGVPLQQSAEVNGQEMHLEKSVFSFSIYTR